MCVRPTKSSKYRGTVTRNQGERGAVGLELGLGLGYRFTVQADPAHPPLVVGGGQVVLSRLDGETLGEAYFHLEQVCSLLDFKDRVEPD